MRSVQVVKSSCYNRFAYWPMLEREEKRFSDKLSNNALEALTIDPEKQVAVGVTHGCWERHSTIEIYNPSNRLRIQCRGHHTDNAAHAVADENGLM